jgi:hypothetical protein
MQACGEQECASREFPRVRAHSCKYCIQRKLIFFFLFVIYLFYFKNIILKMTNNRKKTNRQNCSMETIFGALKKYYSTECEKWMKNHPGRVITVYQKAGIFGPAYSKTATIANAIEGL